VTRPSYKNVPGASQKNSSTHAARMQNSFKISMQGPLRSNLLDSARYTRTRQDRRNTTLAVQWSPPPMPQRSRPRMQRMLRGCKTGLKIRHDGSNASAAHGLGKHDRTNGQNTTVQDRYHHPRLQCIECLGTAPTSDASNASGVQAYGRH